MVVGALIALLPLTFGVPVTNLPGWTGPPLPSRQDAGYITVDDVKGTKYFYWYVEAETNPDTAPLVVWYSGGPGGSGMIGLWTETGPLRLDDENHPFLNTLSNTRKHNVIYLEQPCGVGFSYSNTSSAYSMDDDEAARLNYAFLQRWLAEFPDLQGRPLWLTGESYAGMYIPRLIEQIIAGPDAHLRAALRGVLLGNPHIWCESLPKEDSASHWPFVQSWFYHGLVPYSLFAQGLSLGCDSSVGSASEACDDLYHTIRKAGSIGGLIDVENLHKDHCAGNGSLSGSIEHSEEHTQCAAHTGRGPVYGYKAYLNEQAVKEVLQVEGACRNVSASCGGGKDHRFHYSKSNVSVIGSWSHIFSALPGLQILIYSGDQDIATNPSFLTQTCLHELRGDRGNATRPWASWKVNGWHAGFVEYFERYAFATVQGAGHRVPENQPLAATAMYDRFIATGELDDASL